MHNAGLDQMSVYLSFIDCERQNTGPLELEFDVKKSHTSRAGGKLISTGFYFIPIQIIHKCQNFIFWMLVKNVMLVEQYIFSATLHKSNKKTSWVFYVLIGCS